MNHTVKMILILRMSFVKTDQQEIIKVSGVLLKLAKEDRLNAENKMTEFYKSSPRS